MKIFIFVFSLCIPIAAPGSPEDTERNPVGPFCANVSSLIQPGITRLIQIQDAEIRELLALQAIGADGMGKIQLAVGRPPFEKVQSLDEALALVDRMIDDSTAYKPVNEVLNALPPAQSWALYLNTGFHAVPTHTDGHRSMVQQAIEQFPTNQRGETPTSVLDVGIGSGNLIAAAAIRNPFGIAKGLDIAGAGLNISTWRLNEIADLAAKKYADPAHNDVGRFWVGRGSATDPHLYTPDSHDAASMVLTLFAIPPPLRKKALENVFRSLKPGAKFVLIDPIPRANTPEDGRKFLKDIVRSAYRNNIDLSYMDLAVLTAKNAHGLLKIEFLGPEQQVALAESVGFRRVSTPEPAYYGMTSLTIFEKP